MEMWRPGRSSEKKIGLAEASRQHPISIQDGTAKFLCTEHLSKAHNTQSSQSMPRHHILRQVVIDAIDLAPGFQAQIQRPSGSHI